MSGALAVAVDNDVEVMEQEVKNIKLSHIEQNENSRVVYKMADLSELMHSMKQNGLLQAVGVKRLSGGRYEAVWGNRRIVAAKKLGWNDIPARIVEAATDVDRDIMGLIENIKRQNTTPAEDGRMFASLKERGLSEEEIAARVSISVDRVKLALDVFNHIPKEYQKMITNRVQGTSGKKKAGQISATTAKSILGIRRKYNLSKDQTAKLLDFAKESGVSASQIDHVAPVLKRGGSLKEAISKAAGLMRLNLYVYIDAKNVKKLENKYKKTISNIVWDHLEANKELCVIRTAGDNSNNNAGRMRVVARHTVEV
jgi:ParB family chromosome partitioning protein